MENKEKIKGEVVILTGPKKIKFQKISIDRGNIEAKNVVARTIFSAISPGTETAAYAGKPPLRPGRVYPRLMGYCNVAEVLAVGKSVKAVRPGDKILTHQSHRSIFSIPEENILLRLVGKSKPEEVALTYLYSLGLNSLETIPLKPNMSVAVIGLGVLGLGALELAKKFKVKVLAFSDSSYKLALAKKLGANQTYQKSKSGKLENCADLVITTSNSWEDWNLALRLVKQNGTISVMGFPGRGQKMPTMNPLEPRYFYFKKISIIPLGALHAGETQKEATAHIKRRCLEIVSLMNQKKLQPQRLISGMYDYKEIDKAYKKILARDEKSVTYAITWPK